MRLQPLGLFVTSTDLVTTDRDESRGIVTWGAARAPVIGNRYIAQVD